MKVPVICWHVIRFKFRMLPEGHNYKMINRGDSPVHSLTANEILGPIIQKCEQEMILWRFQRSFRPNKAWHPFTFKFYGPRSLVPEINKLIQSNEVYRMMKEEGLLELNDDKDVACRALTDCPAVKDDNDPNWSDEIKEIWPYYIHGVSQAWLRLIEVFTEQVEGQMPRSSFKEKIDFHDTVNKRIEEQWTKHGQHAMLHHLNAVFGYKYIKVVRPHGFIKNVQPAVAKQDGKEVPCNVMEIMF